MSLAFLSGGRLSGQPPFSAARRHRHSTPWGDVDVGELGDRRAWLIERHGPGGLTAPHAIPHRAHVRALADLGATALICLCSVGALKADIAPGSLLVPDDWLQLGPLPTFQDHSPRHVTPAFDSQLRRGLLDACARLGEAAHDGGVYAQTHGPRLETRAEVRLLAAFADVVGMTLGDEATLACELGLPIAALCVVDNWAHGLGPEPLLAADILSRKAAAEPRLARIAAQLLEPHDA